MVALLNTNLQDDVVFKTYYFFLRFIWLSSTSLSQFNLCFQLVLPPGDNLFCKFTVFCLEFLHTKTELTTLKSLGRLLTILVALDYTAIFIFARKASRIAMSISTRNVINRFEHPWWFRLPLCMALDLNGYAFGRRGLSPPLRISKYGKLSHSIIDSFPLLWEQILKKA